MQAVTQLKIELVFATPDAQKLLAMKVAKGTTAREALLSSDLVTEFPDTRFADCALGIWGKPVADDQLLVAGDRVEAYRPLLHDPRDARRELALQGRSMGQLVQEDD